MKPILKYKNKDLFIRIDEYTNNGRTYLALIDKNGEVWQDLTKNLFDVPVNENLIFLNPNIPTSVLNKIYETGIIINLFDSQKCNMGSYDKAYVNRNKLDEYLRDTYYMNIYNSKNGVENRYYTRDIKMFDSIDKAIQYSKEESKKNNYYKVEIVDYKNNVYFNKEKDFETIYINDLKIKYVPKKMLSEYINCWVEKKELPIKDTLLYAKDGNKYIGVDNTTNDCWEEEFENERDTINWLIGLEKDEKQNEDNLCKTMD